MESIWNVRCLVCGCRYEDEEPGHHCKHCFADGTYLRVLTVQHPASRPPIPVALAEMIA